MLCVHVDVARLNGERRGQGGVYRRQLCRRGDDTRQVQQHQLSKADQETQGVSVAVLSVSYGDDVDGEILYVAVIC